MTKKSITYTDYDGNERTEDFYFNLTKAELVDFLTTSGGYRIDKLIDRLVRQENTKEIFEIFKNLIYQAYGEKSLDGRRFIKSKEVKDNFVETEAYSELYMEIISDPKKAGEFFNSIIPKDLAEEIKKGYDDPSTLPPELQKYMVKPGNEQNGETNIVPIA